LAAFDLTPEGTNSICKEGSMAKKKQNWCRGTELDRTLAGEICMVGSSVR
jgi:hypothetical protein